MNLIEACKKGDIDTIKNSVKLSTKNLDILLETASENGHKEIVIHFLEICKKKKNYGIYSLNYKSRAIKSAAKGGNESLVNYLIEIGIYDFENGLIGAIIGGSLNLTKKFVEKLKENDNRDPYKFHIYMITAIEYGYENIVKYLYDNGDYYLEECLETCFNSNRENLAKFFMECITNNWKKKLINTQFNDFNITVNFKKK